MLTSIRVSNWNELRPWEQVTLVSKTSPETRVQARFHHAIAARTGGYQGMFEVAGVMSARYTSVDWTVIRVTIAAGMPPTRTPLPEDQEAGSWHNDGSTRDLVSVPNQMSPAGEAMNPRADHSTGGVHSFKHQPARRRSFRAILLTKGRAR